MESKILAWCREQRLFEPGAEVCCAVSGGADSTAMLVCLLALRGELKITTACAVRNPTATRRSSVRCVKGSACR